MIEDNFTAIEGRPDTVTLPQRMAVEVTYSSPRVVHKAGLHSNLSSSPPLVERAVKFEHMKMAKIQKED